MSVMFLELVKARAGALGQVAKHWAIPEFVYELVGFLYLLTVICG